MDYIDVYDECGDGGLEYLRNPEAFDYILMKLQSF